MSDAERKVKFPLPKGSFGPVLFNAEQEERCRTIVTNEVAAALQGEREFVHLQNRQMDASQWKLTKKKHNFQIFRRRKHAVGTSAMTTPRNSVKQPSMIGVGRVEGTIEDVLFGWSGNTHEEMEVLMPFYTDYALDGTVLHTIDSPTFEDPFRFLRLKWAVNRLPLMKVRDMCVIEANGTSKDTEGGRYGYIVMHSLDVPNCPPFPRSCAIRAHMFFTFIIRDAGDGTVSVFAQGVYDVASDMVKHLSTISTSEMFLSIFKAVQCAEAKKLTLLAGKNARESEMTPHNKNRSFRRSNSRLETANAACCMCFKSNSLLTRLKTCRICFSPVCTACCAKKVVFLGMNHHHIHVACCPTCILEAKQMYVRPGEEAYSILAKEPLLLDENTVLATDFMDSKTVVLDEKPDVSDEAHSSSRGRSSSASGISEDDMEATIQLLLQQKLEESRRLEEATNNGSQRGYAVVSNDHTAALEQDALFQQMLALQSKTQEIYALTQANHEIMEQQQQQQHK